jgi:outer membrane protein assembly factor BamA
MGEWLSEEMLEAETIRSADRLRNLGYFDLSRNHFSFEADTLADGTADLIYRVREYTRNETPAAARPLRRYYIGQVTITKPENLPFRQKLLRDLATIHAGDLYSETNVANTYSRISNIRVFSSVQVQMTPSDTNIVDCGIQLSQSPVRGIKIKAEGSSNSTGLLGFSPQVSFYHKNFFHGGEWFNLAFSGDFQYRISDQTKAVEYGISTGLSLPKFLGLPYSAFKGPRNPRTEINAANNYQDRPEYNRAVVSAALGYTGVTRAAGRRRSLSSSSSV